MTTKSKAARIKPMSNENELARLIVVAGPTGSGKTSYIIDRLERTSRARDAVFFEYESTDDLPRLRDLLFRSAPNTLIFVELTTNLKPTVTAQKYLKPAWYKTRATPLMYLASEVVEVERVSEGKHTATFLKSIEHPLKIVEFTPQSYFNVYKYVWAGQLEITTEACAKLLVRLGY